MSIATLYRPPILQRLLEQCLLGHIAGEGRSLKWVEYRLGSLGGRVPQRDEHVGIWRIWPACWTSRGPNLNYVRGGCLRPGSGLTFSVSTWKWTPGDPCGRAEQHAWPEPPQHASSFIPFYSRLLNIRGTLKPESSLRPNHPA